MFITEAELGKLFNELSPDDERSLTDRLFTNNWPGRTCPFCKTTMLYHGVYNTDFERCATHGVWLTLQALQDMLNDHADRYVDRNRDSTKLEYFLVVPVVGVLAMPLQAMLRPWAKRRRLRKYLARTTPPAKS